MFLVRETGSRVTLNRGDGRQLHWDVKAFDKTRFVELEDPFKEINGYWSTVPEEVKEIIWETYDQIYYSLDQIADITILTSRLSDLVAQLYMYNNLDDVGHWVRFHERIEMPPDLKDFCGPDDDERTIQRTYLKKDYVDLVVMTVALRIMIPVWGEYIRIVGREVGPNFKEYAAMRLLGRSSVIESDAMLRLRRYVTFSIDTDLDSTSSILSGLGSAERPDWLLSMVIVRRVTPGDLVLKEGKGSLITNIYAFITGALRDIDKKFGGGMRDKFEKYTGEDEDKTSKIELFKVKQQISYGSVALYSVYTENPIQMAQQLDPTVPVEYVQQCLQYTADLYQMEIRDYHLALCQWVVNPVIVARALHTINKASLLRVMAVTQALLWWWEFPDLALLTTAVPKIDDGGSFMAMESRMRIPADLLRLLSEKYPYTENIGRSKGQGKGANVAVKSIQALSRSFNANGWVVHAPQGLTRSTHLVDTSGIMITPPNVLEQLAKLVLRCA